MKFLSLGFAFLMSMNLFATTSDVVIPPSSWGQMPMEDCAIAATSETAVRYNFGSLRSLADKSKNQDGEAWVRDSLLYVYAKTMVQKRRFPTNEELTRLLESFLPKPLTDSEEDDNRSSREIEAEAYATTLLGNLSLIMGVKGIWKNHVELVAAATNEYPEIFARVRGYIQRQAFMFFRHRLRPPSFEELGS